MSEKFAAESIRKAVEDHGWSARLVPARRRSDLWNELKGRFEDGEFDEGFFQEYLAPFAALAGPTPEGICSVLVVAVPDRMVRIQFAWEGQEVAVTIPPTYVHSQERVDDEVGRVVRATLDGSGHHVTPADVPKKLLAARSGLARYGRNNITYVEGMGSYHRLVPLYTSVVCEEDPWSEPQMMTACAECRACLVNCPTGAITEERFLLKAERCLVYWNEKPGDVPFPEWIAPNCHNQLVGCMRCQAVCPQNRGFLSAAEAGDPFTEEETRALLEGATIDELPDETVVKLRVHGVLEYLEVLPRNLGVLLNSSTTR